MQKEITLFLSWERACKIASERLSTRELQTMLIELGCVKWSDGTLDYGYKVRFRCDKTRKMICL